MGSWTLRRPLVTEHETPCEGEVLGPDRAYFDFSDSENWTAAEVASFERLLAAANAAEVYRKALGPFAREFSRQRSEGREFIAIDLEMEVGSPNADALESACRLMGIPLAADSEDVH